MTAISDAIPVKNGPAGEARRARRARPVFPILDFTRPQALIGQKRIVDNRDQGGATVIALGLAAISGLAVAALAAILIAALV